MSTGVRQRTVALGLLGVIELLVYFNNPGHFFQGDTLYWLANPYHSFGEFLVGFFELDPGGWYRPLSQRTVESLLLPAAGLNPVTYRAVTFGLFFGCTVAIFLLIERITEKWLAAVIGTFFFAMHVTNAYTTYDVAFTPELLYTLFYVASTIAYFSYLRQPRLSRLIASLLFLTGSLLSKEAAVTLPFMLTLLWFLDGARNRAGFASLFPHFLILALYLLYVVGYLHVGGFRPASLLESPRRAGLTGYELMLGENVVESLQTALRWAFNYPGGLHGNWMPSARWIFHFLWLFRAVSLIGGILVLSTLHRRNLLFGVFWFFLASAPMLPLLDHFLPYYLFAPLAGMSLAVGIALTEAYDRLSAWVPGLALASLVILLAMSGAVNATMIWEAARAQPLLGGSSQNSLEAISALRAIYPRLPDAATLVFLNEDSPGVWWNHAQGGLFRMAFSDARITAQYSTEGITVTDAQVAGGGVRFLKIRDGRIERYAPYRLELSKTVVEAGKDGYRLRVSELPDARLRVLYSYNGVAMDPFEVSLDAQGEHDFTVDRTTKPGIYKIIAIKRPEERAWVLTNGAVEVR